MDSKLIEQLKTSLEISKAAIEKELGSFATEDSKDQDNWNTRFPNREMGNMEEEADEMQEYDNLLSLEYSLELKLKDVNSALEKMVAGTYGTCEKCGKEIEEKRLQANPAARLCMGCNR